MSVSGAGYVLCNGLLKVPGLKSTARYFLQPVDPDISAIPVPSKHKFGRGVARERLSRCNVWSFSHDDDRWTSAPTYAECPGRAAEPSNAQQRSLKVLTYNLMMNAYEKFVPRVVHSTYRYQATIKMLRDCDADIICLDEVDAEFRALLSRESFVRDNYMITDVDPLQAVVLADAPLKLRSHEVVVLLRRSFKLVGEATQLRSIVQVPRRGVIQQTEARASFIVRIWLGDQIFAIAAAHLEAYNSRFESRAHQLEDIYKYVQLPEQAPTDSSDLETVSADQVVVLGDFNFHQEAESAAIVSPYFDVWSRVNPDRTEAESYTWDGPNNNLIQAMFLGIDERRMRLDRVVLSEGSTSILRPTTIERFGLQTVGEVLGEDSNVPAEASILHPSDHWGLMTTFDVIVGDLDRN